MNRLRSTTSLATDNSVKESLLLLASIGFAILWACLFYFKSPLPPFEDAAMLLRYAEHVAQGHGIVWNVGEHPVDGATDFLFMAMVAGLSRFGMSVEVAARVLTMGAHLVTVGLVHWVVRRSLRGTTWAAMFSAAIVATGPGLSYVQASFGTPVFALAGLVTYVCFLRMMLDDETPANAAWFAIALLGTALLRPEGALLGMGMLLSLAWYLRGEMRKRVLQRFLLLFCLPGLVYFGWHWWYFGHPLPNPFYVKGGGGLYLSSLKASFLGVVKYGTVLLPIMAWAAWKKDARRKTMLLYAPIVLFAVAWIMLSNAMNYLHRFQYVVMPLMWVAWLPIVRWMRPGFALRGKWLLIGVPLVVCVLSFHYLSYARKRSLYPDGRATLGETLSKWKDKGYVMAITEAGNLPFFSKWPAVDTWGLNDAHIAHAGLVDTTYLGRFNPVIVMLHDYCSPGVPRHSKEPQWDKMNDVLHGYVSVRGYALVACWGREPHSTHYYYLRKDVPDFVALKTVFDTIPYRWYEDGELAENFLQDR